MLSVTRHTVKDSWGARAVATGPGFAFAASALTIWGLTINQIARFVKIFLGGHSKLNMLIATVPCSF